MTTSSSSPNLSGNELQALVQAASLAPSSHNTQPWLFRIDGPTVALLADRTRALPVNDPEDRELTISCGCALFNLRVAAATASMQAQVQLLPDTGDEDLLARVRLAPASDARALADLGPAMTERRTYRERFAATVVDPKMLRSLTDAVTGVRRLRCPRRTASDRP